ncbi:MAG TPA: hypothetical protein VH157_00520 [Bryobacteraceae bacterium]|nr:hypothetical protein [Bryobacteraceae bacterium]
MRIRFQPWQLAVLLAFLCVALTVGIHVWRTRGGSNPSDLVAYLPTENSTVVYIDAGAIRRSGILNMIAGSKAAEDLEYEQFVDQTMFDYRQDLDAVAVSFKEGQVYLAARGNFRWKNLMDYAVRQGGSCHNSFCTAPTSRPTRRISFYPLKPNIMGLAISTDDFAAYSVNRKSGKAVLATPDQPLWMLVPAAALKDTDALPAGTKPYASALRNAEQIVFTVGPDSGHLQLSLQVTCRDEAAASKMLVDFQNTTDTLRKWIEREHQQPNPADLSGLLVAGTFRRDDRRVYGQWPVARALVDSLAAESY